MSRRRAAQPAQTRPAGPDDEHWQAFIGFWLVAGVALLVIGTATFAAVPHSHRIAALLMLLGILCLVIGLIVRRAAKRAD